MVADDSLSAAASGGSPLGAAARRRHGGAAAAAADAPGGPQAGKLRAPLDGVTSFPGDAPDDGGDAKGRRCSRGDTLLALLSLQLGWGLWLMPHSFGRLGWLPGLALTLFLAGSTAWSGSLFSRLYAAAPGSVLFGDIGQRAAGPGARALVYVIVYTLDATRCVILQLAATQSLRHALGPAAPSLPACGAAVMALMLLLVQVRSLARLSWFFALGTGAQLAAIGVVCYQMLTNPYPSPRRALIVIPEGVTAVTPGGVGLDDQVVAGFNVIFAYGGQFAFVELLSAMARPSEFPHAVAACTAIMSCLYALLGAFGYLSCGSAATEILVFSFTTGPAARAAGACVLLQALAQYLVNANVWSHNLCTLLGRRYGLRAGAGAPAGPGDLEAAAGCGPTGGPEAEPLVTSEAGAGGLGGGGGGGGAPACSADHPQLPWLMTTAFVVAYSYVIAMTIPFFSTLVGMVASSTYLVCAYTLPCWFALRLLAPDLSPSERAACRAAVPLTLALSALGLLCSVSTLARRLCPGGRCALAAFGAAAGGHGAGAVAPAGPLPAAA